MWLVVLLPTKGPVPFNGFWANKSLQLNLAKMHGRRVQAKGQVHTALENGKLCVQKGKKERSGVERM